MFKDFLLTINKVICHIVTVLTGKLDEPALTQEPNELTYCLLLCP